MGAQQALQLELVGDPLAVCRLEPTGPMPDWALAAPGQDGGVVAITRTDSELSIVCAQRCVPDGVRAERGFRALRVQGTLDFALVGVLSSLLAPLAAAGVSVFVLSTFDTDWLLVRENALDRALAALRAAGFAIHGAG